VDYFDSVRTVVEIAEREPRFADAIQAYEEAEEAARVAIEARERAAREEGNGEGGVRSGASPRGKRSPAPASPGPGCSSGGAGGGTKKPRRQALTREAAVLAANAAHFIAGFRHNNLGERRNEGQEPLLGSPAGRRSPRAGAGIKSVKFDPSPERAERGPSAANYGGRRSATPRASASPRASPSPFQSAASGSTPFHHGAAHGWDDFGNGVPGEGLAPWGRGAGDLSESALLLSLAGEAELALGGTAPGRGPSGGAGGVAGGAVRPRFGGGHMTEAETAAAVEAAAAAISAVRSANASTAGTARAASGAASDIALFGRAHPLGQHLGGGLGGDIPGPGFASPALPAARLRASASSSPRAFAPHAARDPAAAAAPPSVAANAALQAGPPFAPIPGDPRQHQAAPQQQRDSAAASRVEPQCDAEGDPDAQLDALFDPAVWIAEVERTGQAP